MGPISAINELEQLLEISCLGFEGDTLKRSTFGAVIEHNKWSKRTAF